METVPPGSAAGESRRPAGPSLANLQILRAVAAGSVLVYHGFVYLEAVRGASRPSARLDALLGLGGVAVFFAISGFLMARLVAETDPWRFLAHRVLRLYPAFLAVVALSAAAFGLARLPFGVGFAALTLAPVGPRTYPLNVEWTLVFELAFYAGLFALALAGLARRLAPAAAAWLALLALAALAMPAASRDAVLPPLHLLPLSPACAAFAGGLLLPRLIAAGWCRPAFAAAAAPLLLACAWLGLDAARWVAGLAALLVVGAAVQVAQATPRNPLARAAIALGDWSYALYLVHVPAILLVAGLAPAAWPAPAVWVGGVAAALGAACLVGPLDMRAYRWLRRRIDGAADRTRRAFGLAFLTMFLGVGAWGSAEAARDARRQSAARTALATLPPGALLSAEAARAAVAERGLALPGTLAGALEGVEPVSPGELLLGAWAFDPAAPEAAPLLAAFCDGRLAALDRAARLRPDVAARAGLDAARDRRVGYRLRLPRAACRPDGIVAVLVEGGRMAVLGEGAR